MSPLELQQSVSNSLKNLNNLDGLKKLFWSQLNYERVNQQLSRRRWTERVADELAEDPLLLANGGTDNAFQIIYARLKSEHLTRDRERLVVNSLLKDHPYALFVFSNQTQSRWNFINVKYDNTIEKRKLFRRITVGEGEQLRTATEQLSLLDLQFINPDASPLEIQQRHDDAFDVEVVTNKFFAQYRQVFDKVENLIQGLETEPQRKRLFTQKLFNRLMFIAFIQKKGWLKFNRRTDYLSALWEAYQQDNSNQNKNFYRDRLSRLFFLGLNNPSQVDITGINQSFSSKDPFDIGTVPYLNGGLFEQDEDDQNYQIVVPDECIDTILHNLFDRFNFTVTESTPLDVEVAVDPEMLGKVFEELVTGRHESGSYYTPKPIVSFMCREALKGYLKQFILDNSKILIISADLSDAITKFVDEHDASNLNNPEAILEALRKVRICDPACGSGAYLLGMLHELLDLRQCLFNTKKLDTQTVYDRKFEIIENNLYGVDIDPFAINIARLRLWLSLAVDYEGDTPKPLPNLKYKIEQGDSLTAPSPERTGMLRDDFIRKYREAKVSYMRAHLKHEKQKFESEIDSLKTEIARWTHGSEQVQGFDWAVEFAEVFADGGFDIQVANPPYVRQELITHLKPKLKEVYPAVYTGTSDLYCFFYARALQLLRPGGMLAFISSNKWFRAKYGEKLRKHIADTCQVHGITDFGSLPVFPSAATFPMIFIAQSGKLANDSTVFTQVKSLEHPYPNVSAIIRERGQTLPPTAINSSSWMLTDTTSANRLQKMKAAGIPLDEYVNGQIYYGVKTGFNQAFVINGAKRAELIAQDHKSAEIIKPLAVGKDLRKWRVNYQDKWLIYSPWSLQIDNYPAVKKHLSQWMSELNARPECQNGRYNWWCMARYGSEYSHTFEHPKIVFPDITQESRFTLDENGTYINDTTFMISVHDLYLLGVLNSCHVWEYLKQNAAALGDAEQGSGMRLKRIYVEKIPIPNASTIEREAISKLVQKCLNAKGIGCEEWEKEIDEQVAALYGL